MARGFIMQIASWMGGGSWSGPKQQITSLTLTRIFQAGCSRLCFWERSKEQLGQVLNLGLDLGL